MTHPKILPLIPKKECYLVCNIQWCTKQYFWLQKRDCSCLILLTWKQKYFCTFSHLSVFYNFLFSLCTYRFLYSQTSAFDVEHCFDQESPWKGLFIGFPQHTHSSVSLQHRIQLKLHVLSQQFHLTFLRDTYLPEEFSLEAVFSESLILPSDQFFFIAVDFKTSCYSEIHYHPLADL